MEPGLLLESLPADIRQVVERFALPLLMVLEFAAPGATGCYYLSLALKNLYVVANSQATERQILGELRTLNVRVRDIGERLDEATAVSKARNIARASTVYDKSTKTMTAHFFYSQNNMITNQLRGQKYFAYETLSDLFEHVQFWNRMANELSKHAGKNRRLSKFLKRKTIIHLWDHCPSSAKVLSHMNFSEMYQSIEIDNHYEAKHLIIMDSVKVRCSVELKNITVYKLDATEGGKATLRNCDIGWNQKPLAPVPFLFGGSLSDFTSTSGNPYNVCGTVSCIECTTRGNGPKPRTCLVSVVVKEGVEKKTTNTFLKRTISNISDTMWFVKFDADVGDITVCCEGFDTVNVLDTKDCVSEGTDTVKRDKILPYAAIPPCGGEVSFTVACQPRHRTKYSGTLIFCDKNGEQYRQKYSSSLTNYTIASPVIEKTTQPCTQPVPKNTILAKNTILVVGPTGSGKSTFLNALAGVYWKVTSDGNGGRYFVSNPDALEQFHSGSCQSDIGSTNTAVAANIMTFDGREMTVIDTVGYNDRLSCPSIYDNANLTEVLESYQEISAVVVVLDSKNPRVTDRFVQSLAYVPMATKRRIQENIILVFTNWTRFDKWRCQALSKHIDRIKTALEARGDDAIKVFCMDNRRFKSCKDGRPTIENMSSFLDHVVSLSCLSCSQFKAMRAQYLVAHLMTMQLKKYFEGRNEANEKRTKLEIFLSECANHHVAFTLKTPSLVKRNSVARVKNELFELILSNARNELPKSLKQICEETDLQSIPEQLRPMAMRIKEYIAGGEIGFEYTGTNFQRRWRWHLAIQKTPREQIVKSVVDECSKKFGKKFCYQTIRQFDSFVDANVCEIEKFIFKT